MTTSKRRLLLSGCLAGMMFVGVLHARQAVVPHPPDTQKLVLENAFVRVWEVRVPPGAFEPMHRHERGIVIAMSDYDIETRSDPKAPFAGTSHSKLGDVRWAEPVVHEAHNRGTTEQHVIRIELK